MRPRPQVARGSACRRSRVDVSRVRPSPTPPVVTAPATRTPEILGAHGPPPALGFRSCHFNTINPICSSKRQVMLAPFSIAVRSCRYVAGIIANESHNSVSFLKVANDDCGQLTQHYKWYPTWALSIATKVRPSGYPTGRYARSPRCAGTSKTTCQVYFSCGRTEDQSETNRDGYILIISY